MSPHDPPPNARQPSWWAQASIFDGHDPTNERIWNDSPSIHGRHGFTPADLAHAGAVGAQQAMLDPWVSIGLANPTPILPWVPDLLGEEWTHECGIVIVGQNYGQFIAGYTKRPNRMSAYDYAGATTWQDFQRDFVKDVVIDDNSYYELLVPLLQTTKSNARFIVTDLVRNTLVARGTPQRRADTVLRFDTNIDLNDVNHCRVYGSYADLPESTTWLWDRLTGTKASTIVALGRAPLCGLLRIFVNKGCTVTEHKSGTPWKFRGKRWMYNCGISSIEGRLKNGDWHVVNSPVLLRSWHVVLVPHPARENNQYTTAVNVITAARAASGC